MEGLEEETGRTPPALQNRPKFNETERFYWDVYQELHAGRTNNGFGPNQICLRDILDAADLYELWSPESRRDLVRCVRALDRAYFEHLAKKPNG